MTDNWENRWEILTGKVRRQVDAAGEMAGGHGAIHSQAQDLKNNI